MGGLLGVLQILPMTESLWFRNEDLADASTKQTERISTRAQASDSEFLKLRRQVDRLTLTCQSMWELLRDGSDLTEDHLMRKVAEVDLRDGSPDGRLGSTVIHCESCGKNTNSRRDNCVWCGAPVERAHIFEG